MNVLSQWAFYASAGISFWYFSFVYVFMSFSLLFGTNRFTVLLCSVSHLLVRCVTVQLVRSNVLSCVIEHTLAFIFGFTPSALSLVNFGAEVKVENLLSFSNHIAHCTGLITKSFEVLAEL